MKTIMIDEIVNPRRAARKVIDMLLYDKEDVEVRVVCKDWPGYSFYFHLDYPAVDLSGGPLTLGARFDVTIGLGEVGIFMPFLIKCVKDSMEDTGNYEDLLEAVRSYKFGGEYWLHEGLRLRSLLG